MKTGNRREKGAGPKQGAKDGRITEANEWIAPGFFPVALFLLPVLAPGPVRPRRGRSRR
jgi:hypothetical protein